MLKSNLLQSKLEKTVQIETIWKLLTNFKDQCKKRNWIVSKHEDWIKTDNGEYHNFVWTQSVHPLTFDKICENYKVAIQNKNSYRIIKVSYIAWLFLQRPSINMIKKVKKNFEYSKRIAIYDFSQALNNQFLCLHLNKTKSQVFKEFELFLKSQYGIKIEPIQEDLILRVPP